jgi:hypothetical protein
MANSISATGDALRERLDRDGFLVLESTGCELSVTDGAVQDLAGAYREEEGVEDGVGYYRHRIQDAWRISANVMQMALAPRMLEILEGLYERKPLPFQTLNFNRGSEQAVHSDTIHFNSMPAGYMCGVWVALEDIDMANGPLVYYPGSHKLPEITMEDVGAEAGRDHYAQYERFIADLIEREGLEPRYGTIRKGQVFIWAANLLHGGMPQADPQRTRHSQVTHYYFEGCRYYTPMLTDDGHVQWRDPTWISEEEAEASRLAGRYDVERIRELVRATVPERATVLVISTGDDQLLELGDRNALHFPQDERGDYAGYNPADSDSATTALEEQRDRGARYVLIPRAAFWWLEYYREFGEHLEQSGERVVQEEDCILFALAPRS